MQIYNSLLGRKSECDLVRTIDVESIKKGYISNFGYDPEVELHNIKEINLYKCKESDFTFFTPLSTVGLQTLYRQLETFEWNYKEKKWEHDQSLNFINHNAKVLDVGCGQAAFLHRAKINNNAIVTGLEFNESAAQHARDRGVEVHTDTIQTHSDLRTNYYDYVTSFQVLEHVVNPESFIRACIKTLKPGGELILGVPNNDGFLGLSDDNWLNMPPHHMSLWSQSCLENISSIFGITHLQTYLEPLAEKAWFKAVIEEKYLAGGLKSKLYYKFGFDKVLSELINNHANWIPGHTIMAKFKK